MFALIAENWWLFLIALLIGVATAWWVWAGDTVEDDETVYDPRRGSERIAAPDPAAAAPLMDVSKIEPEKPKVAPKKKAAAKPKAKAATAKKAPAKKAAKPKAKKASAKKTAAKPKAKAATAKKTPARKAATKKTPVKKAPAKKPAAKKAAPKKAAAPKIPDNLELLKGVGPKLNKLLGSLGVTSFGQVAGWSAADIREIDSKLGAFAGRITRDNWIDQAKLLSKGDVKAFEKKYGSLGSEIER